MINSPLLQEAPIIDVSLPSALSTICPYTFCAASTVTHPLLLISDTKTRPPPYQPAPAWDYSLKSHYHNPAWVPSSSGSAARAKSSHHHPHSTLPPRSGSHLAHRPTSSHYDVTRCSGSCCRTKCRGSASGVWGRICQSPGRLSGACGCRGGGRRGWRR